MLFGLTFDAAGAGELIAWLVGCLVAGFTAGGVVVLLVSAGPRR